MAAVSGTPQIQRYDALGLVLDASHDEAASPRRASPRASCSTILQSIDSIQPRTPAHDAKPKARRVSRDSRPSTSPSAMSSSASQSPTRRRLVVESPEEEKDRPSYPGSPLSDAPYTPERASFPGNRHSSGSSSVLPTQDQIRLDPREKRPARRATHDAAGPSMLTVPRTHTYRPTRSERAPESSHKVAARLPRESRSPSIKRGRDHRYEGSPSPLLAHAHAHNHPEISDSVLDINTESQSAQYQALQRSSSLKSSWSHRAHRLPSSFTRGHDSAAFALRLAEGASPYLRAGLEELRSIFDVDSMPIPPSPFEDDDSEVDDAERAYIRSPTRASSTSASSSPTLARHRDRHGSRISPVNSELTVFSAMPLSASPQNVSPSLHTEQEREGLHRRTSSQDDAQRYSSGHGSPQDSRSEKLDFGAWAKTRSMYSAITPLQERDAFIRSGQLPNARRRFVAWSLAVIAIGLTSICAWGYATQADAFSSTLVGFFLAQPAFALMGLASILLRRRALMDLCSRAMRAHVLAQALIVVLAYLDLSASSMYTISPNAGARGLYGSSSKQVIHMVPSMEMRFGPLHAPTEAGAATTYAAHPAGKSSTDGDEMRSTVSRVMAQAFADGTSGSSSLHAHDTHVGDWRSRLTHLVVFLVQGAIPILFVLVSQYIVAQRLASLARRGSLSRQGSTRSNTSATSSSLPTCTRKVDASRSVQRDTALQSPSGALAVRRASKSMSQSDMGLASVVCLTVQEQPRLPQDVAGRRRHTKRRPNTIDGASVSHRTGAVPVATQAQDPFLIEAKSSTSASTLASAQIPVPNKI